MRRWALLIGIAVLVVLAVIRIVIGNPQLENMEKARAHAPKVTALLHADTRFADVQAAQFSGQGGSLAVHGYVSTVTALQDLKRLVESTSPPVRVLWFVRVLPTTETLSKSMSAKNPRIAN
jgi:hypothetical protein